MLDNIIPQSLNPFALSVKASTTISSLRIYPIKSCRGLELTSSTLTKRGLDLDRNWMFVAARDGKQHKFVTIRDIPELTLVDTALEHGTDSQELQLAISLRNDPSNKVSIPARPSQDWLAAHTIYAHADIWGLDTDAWLYPASTTAHIAARIGQDVRLVYKGPAPRVLRGNGAPDALGREESTNFPDVLPILVANEASLAELNGRLANKGVDALTIERFRPNVIVKGGGECPAWSEDDWKTLRIVTGEGAETLEIDVQAHCARCQVPNVDPETAHKDKHEPWDTLVSYRRIDEGIKWKPCFGMLSCPRNEGPVAVGMKVEVLETTGEHRYIVGF